MKKAVSRQQSVIPATALHSGKILGSRPKNG